MFDLLQHITINDNIKFLWRNLSINDLMHTDLINNETISSTL